MSIILASKSPRRQKLLDGLDLRFKVMESGAEEHLDPYWTAEEAVQQLALSKARAVSKRVEKEDLIIGADTVVVFEGEIMGKPSGKSEAFAMLTLLSGNWHEVYTGLALIGQEKEICIAVKTKVKFCELSSEEIEHYIETGEPLDKAGAYGIQDKGGAFIEAIEGDYYNVVGLPLCPLRHLLKQEFHIEMI